jgi:hypothetical protein
MPYQYYYNPYDFDYKYADHPERDEEPTYQKAYDGQTAQSMLKYRNKQGGCGMCPTTVSLQNGHFIYVNYPHGGLRIKDRHAVLIIDAHGTNQGTEETGRSTTAQVTGFSRRKAPAQDNVPMLVPQQSSHINDDLALTPYWLSKIIEKEMLPYDHRAIKLVSCFGAGGASPAQADEAITSPVKGFTATAPFAKLLAIELGRRGYIHICVGGYRGEVTNTATCTDGVVVPSWDGAGGAASHTIANQDKDRYMAWYNAAGNAVEKPVGLRSLRISTPW